MALLGQKTGNVLDRIIAASDEEKRRNREVIKTLIRSLYFLVKHRVPQTTTLNDLISLQADNGNEIIKQHLSAHLRLLLLISLSALAITLTVVSLVA